MHEAWSIGASYLIRAAKDRSLFNGKNRNEPSEKLWEALELKPVKGRLSVIVPRKKDRSQREAQVTVQYGRVELRPPYRVSTARSGELGPIIVTAILVQEENPPKGEQPIEWMLLTDLSVTSFREAKEKIGWYEKRWTIECYHKVMKSGFKVEACQLHTVDRLYRFITLVSILAVRLQAMTHLARQTPDKSCEEILTKDEWRALYCKVNRTQKPPQKPPDIKIAILWIAILGGYLARNSDPPPGSIVIWRGWQRLTEITDDWIIFSNKLVGKG
jgi:hypothetical protein